MAREPSTEQRIESIKADMRHLREQRIAAWTLRDEGVAAKTRAEQLVYQADAQIDNAEISAGVLTLQLEEQLEALHELVPKPREED